jgi:hypothetical protein
MGAFVANLARLGPQTDKSILDAIFANKEEAIPYLIKLATAEEYWNIEIGKDYSIWAPICAIHILSVIGGKESCNAIEEAIRKYYDDTEDWLTEDMPSVLAALGPDSSDMLERMVKDRNMDIWVRDGTARALLMISKKYPQTRKKAIQILIDAIASEQDTSARTLLLEVLIEFKDKESMPFIKSLFDRKLVDTFDLPYQEVLDVYDGVYDNLNHDIPKDPMHIFNENGNFYWKTNCTMDEHLRNNKVKQYHYDDGYIDAITPPMVEHHNNYRQADTRSSKKIGRNDPCPCRSGKKYKKCCMKIV